LVGREKDDDEQEEREGDHSLQWQSVGRFRDAAERASMRFSQVSSCCRQSPSDGFRRTGRPASRHSSCRMCRGKGRPARATAPSVARLACRRTGDRLAGELRTRRGCSLLAFALVGVVACEYALLASLVVLSSIAVRWLQKRHRALRGLLADVPGIA
jgi:hypothetical protein